MILPNTGFLRIKQILQIIPVSKSTWWAGCASGRFPKPIKFGEHTTMWRVEDIKKIIAQLEQPQVISSTPLRLKKQSNYDKRCAEAIHEIIDHLTHFKASKDGKVIVTLSEIDGWIDFDFYPKTRDNPMPLTFMAKDLREEKEKGK